jgi:hypothetical protein
MSQPDDLSIGPIASKQSDPERRRPVAWGVVVVFTLFGVALLAWAGLLTRPIFGQDFVSGVLVNIGATFLIAAVLVWFERRLTRSTKHAVQDAVSGAADVAGKAAAHAVQQVAKDINARWIPFKIR